MSERDIVRMSLEEIRAEKSETDWERLQKEEPENEDSEEDFPLDWSRAVIMPSTKKTVTMRLDPDVLDFFRAGGKGYQTRINAVLRAFMEASNRNHD